MTSKEPRYDAIFTASGCLTAGSLASLTRGTLAGDELILARNHLAGCDLCKDSLVGLSRWFEQELQPVNTPEATLLEKRIPAESSHDLSSSFTKRIAFINERLQSRIEVQKQLESVKKARPIPRPYGMVAVAASIILFLGIYYMVRLKPNLKQPSLALENKMVKEQAAPATSFDSVIPPVSPSSRTGKKAAPLQKSVVMDETILSENEDVEILPEYSPPSNTFQAAEVNTRNESLAEESHVLEYKVPVTSVSPVVTAEGINKMEMPVAGIATDKKSSKRAAYSNEDVLREAKAVDEVFMVVESMPEFPGGQDKLNEFLAKNIKYPDLAKEAAIQGTVYINFIVDRKGRIHDVKVIRGIGGGCDEEALRVVNLMPRWKPGKQSDKAVRVMFNLPIQFILQ